MLTLTSFRFFSSAIRSSTGATAWQGPHHSAQKSTSTGSPAWSTSFSNVASVTSVAIQRSFRFLRRAGTRSSKGKNVALYTSLPDERASLPDAADGARPSGARGGDPRLVGAGENLSEAPRPERRRAALFLLRRAGHGQQDARRPHGLGADVEGRLPALQGPARIPPALPERLRLPGAVGRGRRRARARAELEA